jgi:hypothetical protein
VFGNAAFRGGSQWAPWTATSYVATSYRWNSTGGANTGQDRVLVADAAAETYVRFDGTPDGRTTSIMVSGYGPYRCNLHRDGAAAPVGPSRTSGSSPAASDASGALVTQAVVRQQSPRGVKGSRTIMRRTLILALTGLTAATLTLPIAATASHAITRQRGMFFSTVTYDTANTFATIGERDVHQDVGRPLTRFSPPRSTAPATRSSR